MKKMILIIFLASFMYACTHKTIFTGDKQVAAALHDKNSNPAIILSGRYVYQSKCGSCHGLKNVAAYTASQWNGILQVMIPRAQLDDLETRQLVSFIKTQVSD